MRRNLFGVAALCAAGYAYVRFQFWLKRRRNAWLLSLPNLPGVFPFGNAVRMGKDGQIKFFGDLRELILREQPERCMGATQIMADHILVPLME